MAGVLYFGEVSELPAKDDRFPEGMVSLLLAEYLLSQNGPDCFAMVAIDGASVKVHGEEIFPIEEFLESRGWRPVSDSTGKNSWTRRYSRRSQQMEVHSKPGSDDVVIEAGDIRFVAECKKGPPSNKKGSPERPLLHTAIGQAMTFDVEKNDVVIAAVPDTPVFRRLAAEWRTRELIVKSGLKIALVNRDGTVTGL